MKKVQLGGPKGKANLLPQLVLLMTMATATTISAQGVIDVHSHIITHEFVSALEAEGRVMDEGFPLPKYDVENHLKWMDEAGVETSVLTLVAPQPISLTPSPSPMGEGSEYSAADLQADKATTPLSLGEGSGVRLFSLGEGSGVRLLGMGLFVRLAEIEVYPQYLEEYLAFASEVDRLSIEREPGVICLYPMQSAEDSCQIRILEIYASEEAYQQHLKTDHFLRYKQGTLHMVKDLKLPTMKPLDPETMKQIFIKQR